MTTTPKPLRCHKCKSADLTLFESHLEHAEYDGGLFVSEHGQIEARGEGFFTAGDPVPSLTRIKCESCGHEWHPRRPFAGAELGS